MYKLLLIPIICLIFRLLSVLPVYASFNESSFEKGDKWQSLKARIKYFSDENPDSLYKYLLKAKALENEAGLNTLQKLFIHDKMRYYYVQTGQSDSAIQASRKALKLAQKSGKKDKIYRQTYHLANAFDRIYNSDSALPYYRSAIQYYRKAKDSIPLAKALSGEASALLEIGHNKTALERLHEAAKILVKTDLYFEIGKVYDNIAMVNAELGYEEKTNEYGRKAIAFYARLEDSVHLANAYANFGVSCKNLGQYDTAMYYYQQSNKIARRSGDKWIMAKNLLNMGNIRDIMGDPQKAKEHFLASLQICLDEGILLGEFFNNINLGELELSNKEYDSAISYFKKAVTLGETYKLDKLDVAYYNLHEALSESGKYQEALKYLRIHNEYQDSLLEAQKHREIMELQTRFETQKKEAQILKLTKQRQKDELLRAYLFLGIGGLIVLGLLIFIWVWRKHAVERQKALQLEKDNQKNHDKMEKLQLEKKLEHEEAERYRLDLRVKEQELVYQTLKQAGLSHLNQKVKDELSPFAHRLARKKDQELFRKKIQEISRESNKDPLSDFEEMFKQMHDNFYEKLLEIGADLTQNDLQMAALLRMNISSKEIAALLNLAVETIDRRRHTIRKKLNLSSDQNLVSFLISI